MKTQNKSLLTSFKKSGKNKFAGFTLVEILIVITILATLSTIAFLSFSSYTSDSRDANRISTISSIEKGLNMYYFNTKRYPDPDGEIKEGKVGDQILAKVGIIGENVTINANLFNVPIDPLSQSEYVYGVSGNNRSFQIATTLETLQVNNSFINQTYADNTGIARVVGDYNYPLKLGNKLYSLPSLIFTDNQTDLSQIQYFVIDKGRNLPYLLKNNQSQNNIGVTEVLKELTGKDNLTFTGVEVPNVGVNDFNDGTGNEILDILGIDKDTLGKIIYGGGYTAPVVDTTCENGFYWAGSSCEPIYIGYNVSSVGGQEAYYAGVYEGRTLWVAGTESETTLQWKITNNTTSNAGSSINGKLNTGVMTGDGTHPAGEYCNNLVWAGYNDWYLPASGNNLSCSNITGELQYLYCTHKGNGSENLLGFLDLAYWSSSQTTTYIGTKASRGVNFGSPSYFFLTATEYKNVRCVRDAS